MLETSQVTNQLRNKRPGVRYLFCPADRKNPLLQQYESVGWRVVAYQTGGVCPMGNLEFTVGEPIIVEGSVLLELDDDTYQQHYWYGASGSSGQDLLDQLEKMVVSPETFAQEQLHSVRSYSNGLIGVTNQSTLAGRPERPGA